MTSRYPVLDHRTHVATANTPAMCGTTTQIAVHVCQDAISRSLTSAALQEDHAVAVGAIFYEDAFAVRRQVARVVGDLAGAVEKHTQRGHSPSKNDAR